MATDSSTGIQPLVYRVLIVEDNTGYASILRRRLSLETNTALQAEVCGTLKSALEHLAEKGADAVLLDLFLPDSGGMETFLRVHKQVPQTAVVVLTSLDDEALGLEAVRKGAQDYLVKGQVDSRAIARVLRYAVERNRQKTQLKNLSLVDDLTALHNRRGFFALAEQQLKLAARGESGLLLFFMDVDGFKGINDTYGHPQGDSALVDAAHLLKSVFRESDILARMGGDEFAALAVEAHENNAEMLLGRLREKIDEWNSKKNHPFELTFSVGVSRFDPKDPCSLDELIARADRQMYHMKQAKQRRPIKAADKPAAKRRILVVEDDGDINQFLTLRLRHAGYEVATATDGVEGLEQARKLCPDLIILDLRLPRLLGEDVCKAIREDHNKRFAETPILMLTAKSSDVDRVIGNVIGASGYMTKPFQMNELLDCVSRLASSPPLKTGEPR